MDEPTAKDLKYLRFASAGAAIFSTCVRAQYMAILLDDHGFVSGVGYNGAAHGMVHCSDGGCPRAHAEVPDPGYTDCISLHAEQNALLHGGGVVMYVNGTPCFTCAKLIANAGIRRLVFLYDLARDWPKSEAYLEGCGVVLVPVEDL